jgi:hypothetical protein
VTRVDEMELSFYRGWGDVLVRLQAETVARDGEGSIWWRGCGMTGALIFHASYADGRVRLPVGTWSIHT